MPFKRYSLAASLLLTGIVYSDSDSSPVQVESGEELNSSRQQETPALGKRPSDRAQERPSRRGERTPPHCPPERPAQQGPCSELFLRVDADKDGAIDLNEFSQHSRLERASEEQKNVLFSRLDKNGDGFIREDEVAFPPDAPRPPNHFLKNGPVSFDQFCQFKRISELSKDEQTLLFKRLDKNQDRTLTKEDLRRRFPKGPGGRLFGPERDSESPSRKGRPPIVDTNDDQEISWAEFQAHRGNRLLSEAELKARFESMDTNQDGVLSSEERLNGLKTKRPRRPKGAER